MLDALVEKYILAASSTNLRGQNLWIYYSDYCHKKAEELTKSGVVLGDFINEGCDGKVVVLDSENKNRTSWTAGDVDMACFAWIQGWCPSKGKQEGVNSHRSSGGGRKPPINVKDLSIQDFNNSEPNPPKTLSVLSKLFIRENQTNTLSVKMDCEKGSANLAWIQGGWLNFKPHFLTFVNQILGDNQRIENSLSWRVSNNGNIINGGGTGYIGGLFFESNVDALQFLKSFITLSACNENNQITQAYLNNL